MGGWLSWLVSEMVSLPVLTQSTRVGVGVRGLAQALVAKRSTSLHVESAASGV